MPELPEVERGRVIAARVCQHRAIVSVRCPEDPILLDGVSAAGVRRALRGRTVRAVHRRGKHLWFELDRAPHPLLHFGMTGSLQAYETPTGRGASRARPAHCRLELALDHGWTLAFADPRRFGRLRLRHAPAEEPPISALGFDPLLDLPDAPAFHALLTVRRAPVKAVLLDQSFAAGVGNWIADEVLYQARLDPRRSAATLSAPESTRLRRALDGVIRRAVEVMADKSRFPRTWLFHHRWGRQAGARTARGEPIEHIVVAGRTTAWVPERQATPKPAARRPSRRRRSR